MKVVILGAGSFGTAMAWLLSHKSAAVELVCRSAAASEKMALLRRNPAYLSHVRLAPCVRPCLLAEADIAGAALVICALPARAVRQTLPLVAPHISKDAVFLSVTKGFEPEQERRLSELYYEYLPRTSVALLAGPCHAEEIVAGQPSVGVIAAARSETAQQLQQLLLLPDFRLYRNDDMVGVEIAAASKNVIALAAGMGDGLGYGDNAKAALLTRGIAEMARLGQALGGSLETFVGLAGIGDVVATATSRHSRNRRAGELIAQGVLPAQVEARIGMVAEGLHATKTLLKLAAQAGVEMPISTHVGQVLFEGRDPRACVGDLMGRDPRDEMLRSAPSAKNRAAL